MHTLKYELTPKFDHRGLVVSKFGHGANSNKYHFLSECKEPVFHPFIESSHDHALFNSSSYEQVAYGCNSIPLSTGCRTQMLNSTYCTTYSANSIVNKHQDTYVFEEMFYSNVGEYIPTIGALNCLRTPAVDFQATDYQTDQTADNMNNELLPTHAFSYPKTNLSDSFFCTHFPSTHEDSINPILVSTYSNVQKTANLIDNQSQYFPQSTVDANYLNCNANYFSNHGFLAT